MLAGGAWHVHLVRHRLGDLTLIPSSSFLTTGPVVPGGQTEGTPSTSQGRSGARLRALRREPVLQRSTCYSSRSGPVVVAGRRLSSERLSTMPVTLAGTPYFAGDALPFPNVTWIALDTLTSGASSNSPERRCKSHDGRLSAHEAASRWCHAGTFARRYWRFVACLASLPIHDHPTFSTIQRAEIVARMKPGRIAVNTILTGTTGG